MANRRMISKSISTSTRLADTSMFASLLYTWTIPHCDDFGRMDGSARIVKAMVMPLRQETVDDVEKALQELSNTGLIRLYEVENRRYMQIDKWEEHQTFKKDRPRQSDYPRNPLDSKRKPEDSNVPLREVKLSKDKEREEKPTASLIFLKKVPSQELQELANKYRVAPAGIQSKATDLLLYCEGHGKRYKNYKAMLENALRKDAMKLRQDYPIPRPVMPEKVEKDEPISEAAKAKMAEIREKLFGLAKSKTI